MRFWMTCAAVALAAGTARATCPPDCMAGGGPAATDCFVAWSGIAAPAASCVDGTACDADGTADGTCAFALEVCANVAGLDPCVPGTLAAAPVVKGKNAAAGILTTALAGLDPAASACASITLPVAVRTSLAGIKPGTVKLTVTAVSASKRDKDKLKLTCLPNPTPLSLARDVQPIFGERVEGQLVGRCAYSGCHDASFQAGGQSLEPADAYASSVNVPSINSPKLLRVTPGSLKKSFMARKILGQGIGFTSTMPQGCPGFPPAGGCLTDGERFTILSWIANGAQP